MGYIIIGDVIKELRKAKGISQETLADVCGVSMQAVSKWENGQSYPDITFLPKLAEYFSVTMDFLLTGVETDKSASKEEKEESATTKEEQSGSEFLNVPPDWGEDVLYIAQCRNGVVLSEEKWERDKVIKVVFDKEYEKSKNKLQIQIVGNADIQGDVAAKELKAGGDINCGDVEGNINAGGGMNCGDVDGSINVGGSMNCGDVDGNVNAGGRINCGDVDGNLMAGAEVECGDIDGDVTAGVSVTCDDIGGNVKCMSVKYK